MERRTELTHAPCLIFIVAIVADSVTLETSIAAIDALKAGRFQYNSAGLSRQVRGPKLPGEDKSLSRRPPRVI